MLDLFLQHGTFDNQVHFSSFQYAFRAIENLTAVYCSFSYCDLSLNGEPHKFECLRSKKNVDIKLHRDKTSLLVVCYRAVR